MSDLISRSWVLNALTVYGQSYDYMSVGRAAEVIEDAPTIDAEPVRRGKWKHDKDDVIISGYCSECGWSSIICETDVAGMSYCPNCGAKMEETWQTK